MKQIQIYSDGSSRGNGQENSRAGAAALLRYGEHMRAVGVYLGPLTNQQAEVVAACIGLEALNAPCEVSVFSDSRYVVETMNEAFARKTNHEFWSRLDLAASRHAAAWHWVESCSKKNKKRPPDPYQETCDHLARAISAMGEVNERLLEEAVNRLRGENTPAIVRAVMDALSQWGKPALIAFSDSDPVFPYPRAGEAFSGLIPGAGEQVRIVGKKTHAQSHLTVLRSADGRRFRLHPTRGQLLIELADDVEDDGEDA